MIFERKITQKLLDWKENIRGEKALLIEGARRIGKSTAVEEFAKKYYKSYILIDFSYIPKNIKDAFENHLTNLDNFFMLLSIQFNKKLYKRESLIIFDEVQSFPKAREAIKVLVKDGRYDYIETGSLISIKENVRNILIPSEERKIKMYPMDFEEFCMALGENQIVDYIKECFIKKEPMLDALHKKAMFLFKQYILVGGMPKPVDAFIKMEKQFGKCDAEKRDILNLYRDDIAKIDNKYKAKVQAVFDNIPGFLSSHEKKIKINSIDNKNRSINYAESFFWLNDSMICNECFLCNDPNIGLALNENTTSIKCYMADTGLLVSHTFSDNESTNESIYSKILSGSLSINKGMFFENIVAQMLTSLGHKLYFYTSYNKETHHNDIEIDFLINSNSKTNPKICPIEVKSSKNYTTSSLNKFIKKFHERIDNAYIIHPKNYSYRDNITYLPVYMTICL